MSDWLYEEIGGGPEGWAGQVLAKKSKSVGSFSGSYSRGPSLKVYSTRPIQSALQASTGGHSGVIQ